MVTYKDKEFYSTYEFAGIIKNDEELKELWSFYRKDVYRSDVQTVLDKARKNNVIKFLKFTTRPEGGKTRYMYSKEDLIDFLKKKISLRELASTCGVYNVEYN